MEEKKQSSRRTTKEMLKQYDHLGIWESAGPKLQRRTPIENLTDILFR
jgi:hypothetical protein